LIKKIHDSKKLMLDLESA